MVNLNTLATMVKGRVGNIVPTMKHLPIVFLCHQAGLDIVGLTGRPAPGLREAVAIVLAAAQPDAYLVVAEARHRKGAPEDVSLYHRGDIQKNASNPECVMVYGYDRIAGETAVWFAELSGALPQRTLGQWRDMGQGQFAGPALIREW